MPTVREALDALRREAFDVVLLDYDLDDVKGDVFLRRRGARAHLPVIAVSAKPDGNEKLLAAGADASCPKSLFANIEASSVAWWRHARRSERRANL